VDAAGVLAAAGLPATFYINSSSIGGPFNMTLDQLKAIASSPVGNEIGGHGVYHTDLSTLDANEQRRMVCDDRNWLLAQGLDVTSFAYPYSNFGNGAATAVAECGYTNARAGWQLRPDSPATCCRGEQLLGEHPAGRRVRHSHHRAGGRGHDPGRAAADGARTPGRTAGCRSCSTTSARRRAARRACPRRSSSSS
jgi:peptidoglycan/xylan/chitin deacetylase (PgdA/CDA1 family)